MLQTAKYRCCFVYFDGFYSHLKNSENWPPDFIISRAWTRIHGDKCHRVGGKWDLLSVSNA